MTGFRFGVQGFGDRGFRGSGFRGSGIGGRGWGWGWGRGRGNEVNQTASNQISNWKAERENYRCATTDRWVAAGGYNIILVYRLIYQSRVHRVPRVEYSNTTVSSIRRQIYDLL